MKQIQALVYLAWHFAKTLALRIVQYFAVKLGLSQSQARQNFLDAYSDDAISVLSAVAKSDMAAWSRCTHCKLCDVVCPQSYPISYIATSVSRSSLFYGPRLDSETCKNCTKCEKACPQGLPLARLLNNFQI